MKKIFELLFKFNFLQPCLRQSINFLADFFEKDTVMGDSDDGARIGCQKLANLRLGGGREVAGWLVQKEDIGAV